MDILTAQLKDIVEVLIDNLVDPEQTTDFVSPTSHHFGRMTVRCSACRQKLVHCVKTVYILLTPEPSMLEVGKAAMLLPYLKSATNVSSLPKYYILAHSLTSGLSWCRWRSKQWLNTSQRYSLSSYRLCHGVHRPSLNGCKTRFGACLTSQRQSGFR